MTGIFHFIECQMAKVVRARLLDVPLPAGVWTSQWDIFLNYNELFSFVFNPRKSEFRLVQWTARNISWLDSDKENFCS